MTALPDGFVLDTAQGSLPAGFALDKPQPSTLGYIGTRFLGGLLEGGRRMGIAAGIEMGQPELQQDLEQSPTGDQTANKAIYGVPNVQAPNTPARYLGAISEAAGESPVLSAIAPGMTAASAAASQGAADLGGNAAWQIAAGLAPALLARPSAALLNLTKAPEKQAAGLLRSRLEADASAGGPTAETMRTDLANANGAPLTLADVGGEGVKGLAERVATAPGESRQIATQFLNDRDAAAGTRLVAALDQNISNGGDAFTTAKALGQQRAAEAAPLYQKAFEGGSTAPLESQLRDSLQQATAAKGTIAAQIAKIERENPGALAARGAAGADTRARYMQLHQDLAQAEADRVATMEAFQKAKQDGMMDAPGAVWNPRIQQFLNDPIMKSGIAQGLEIQRLEALASGKPFNPTEYAITGTDEAGKPIVGSVPNMRLLDAAKRGLDNMLDQYRDPMTGRLNLDQRGRAIDQVRQSFLKELDSINPDYAAARNAYAGPSRSLDAMRQGQNFRNMRPEMIADSVKNMTDSERDFFKLGAADALRQNVAKTSSGGNEALRIVGNNYIKQQLRPLFGSNNAYDNFIRAATNENRMFQTRAQMLGNSRTAMRLAESQAQGEGGGSLLGNALQAGTAMLLHEPIAGAPAFIRLGKAIKDKVTGPSPEVNAALARMLFNPAISNQAMAQALATKMAPRYQFAPGLLMPSMLNPQDRSNGLLAP